MKDTYKNPEFRHSVNSILLFQTGEQTPYWSDAFDTDTRILFKDLTGYVGMNPICPRFLQKHYFDIFYKNSERGALGMSLHETEIKQHIVKAEGGFNSILILHSRELTRISVPGFLHVPTGFALVLLSAFGRHG